METAAPKSMIRSRTPSLSSRRRATPTGTVRDNSYRN